MALGVVQAHVEMAADPGARTKELNKAAAPGGSQFDHSGLSLFVLGTASSRGRSAQSHFVFQSRSTARNSPAEASS